ncbi:hypothetical protein JCM11641_005353 [Rhodosporidiobolus odoratus]
MNGARARGSIGGDVYKQHYTVCAVSDQARRLEAANLSAASIGNLISGTDGRVVLEETVARPYDRDAYGQRYADRR